MFFNCAPRTYDSDDYCKWEVVGVDKDSDGFVTNMLIQYYCIGMTHLRDIHYVCKDEICPFCGRKVLFMTLAEHIKSVEETQRKMKLRERDER